MRTFTAGFFALALVANSSFAYAEGSVLLPSGKPAGVKNAAMLGSNLFLVFLAAGIVIGGISLAVSNPGGNGGVTTATTTGTAP